MGLACSYSRVGPRVWHVTRDVMNGAGLSTILNLGIVAPHKASLLQVFSFTQYMMNQDYTCPICLSPNLERYYNPTFADLWLSFQVSDHSQPHITYSGEI